MMRAPSLIEPWRFPPIRRRHMRSKPPFCKTKGDSLKRLRSWRASLRARQKIMSLLVGSHRRRMNAASIALFGDHDAAIAVLPELLRVPAGLTVANLKFDPFWDPLRNDPRFQKLCQQ